MRAASYHPRPTDATYRAIFSPETAGIFRKYAIRRAFLFGSYAHREETAESDVDLLVERDEPFDLESYMGLKGALEARLRARVDLVPRQSVRTFAREEIEREKVALFDAGNE